MDGRQSGSRRLSARCHPGRKAVGLEGVSAREPHETFMALLMVALRHFGSGDPLVMDEHLPEHRLFPADPAWPIVPAPSDEDLQASLAELSTRNTVLLVPTWERWKHVPEVKEAGQPRFRYDDALRRIRPWGEEATIAVLLPAAALSSGTSSAVRTRELVGDHWDTLAVIYCDAMPSMHSNFEAAAVFLCAKRSVRPPIKLYRVPRKVESAALQDDFRNLLKRAGGSVNHGYVLRGAPEAHVGLGFDRHEPALLARRESLAGFGRTVPLSDLYDFPSTLSLHVARRSEWICEENDFAAVRILRGRDVGRDGLIEPPDEGTVWTRGPAEYRLLLGDLVMRRIYGGGDSNGLVIATVRQEDLPAVASDSLIVLRPRPSLDPSQADFALRFMRSPLARSLLAAMSNRIRTDIQVSRAALAGLSIPQPDRDLREALDDLEAAKQQLQAWCSEAEDILQSVFVDGSPAVARTRVIESGRALRLKVETASLLDDLGYTVRTRFPYPVAARWRQAEALESSSPSAETYGAILDTTEILLCYAAQLALALSREEGIELGALQGIRQTLQRGRGPGLGDWGNILNETATSRKLRSLPQTHPLNDLRTLLADDVANGARQRLTQRRNDQAHLRRVDLVDLPAAINESLRDLKTLLNAARFLTDWPLIQVTGVRWDSLARTSQISFLELMGDHPVVPTRSESHSENSLETDSLYLRGRDRKFYLLRPFLIGRQCPVCRTWSTFHIDRALDSSIVLKSLEHGHTVEDPALARAVSIVGLL